MQKEVEMEELQDYSGELKPDLKMHDFSKDALVRAWYAAAKLYIGLDGLWYTLIRERFGEQMALELDTELWKRAAHLEVRRVREAMNIWGDDVASVLKFLQVDPGGGGILDLKCELKHRNDGILTVTRCRGLEYFERHGETAAQKNACEVLDAEGFAQAAHFFNPNIKVTPLKLPPRKSQNEIACQWEFKTEA